MTKTTPQDDLIVESVSSPVSPSSALKQQPRQTCPYQECGKDFQNKARLRGHIALVHIKVLPFACEKSGCDKSFSMLSQLNRHITRCHDSSKTAKKRAPMFQCSDCDERFDRKTKLRAHNHQVHGEAPAHRCSVCEKVFYDKFKLDRHNKKVHAVKIHRCDQPACDFTTEKWSLFRKHYVEHRRDTRCRYCSKQLSNLSNRWVHEREVHLDETLKDPSLVDDRTLPQTFNCPHQECKKIYVRKSNLNQHIKSAHQAPTLACPECDRMFALKQVLNRHLKNVHQREPRSNKTKLAVSPAKCDANKLARAKKLATTKVKRSIFVNSFSDPEDNGDAGGSRDFETSIITDFGDAKPLSRNEILCGVAQSSLV